ncbi:MAG: primosomal protein N' [Nitrospirota bacterium]|nr:primosomal protein N' [Nitrospirota bacterium]
MLKFFMSYFDILFPINLGPLTYKCPEGLKESARPGMMVVAPLKNKPTKGIIFNRNSSPPNGRIKEFSEVLGDSPVLGKGILDLIKWMSGYYIAHEGLVLKQTLPVEIFVKTKAKKPRKPISANNGTEFPAVPEKELSEIITSISEDKFSTFLMHSPSVLYEFSTASKLLESTTNVILLLPEISQANLLYVSLSKTFGERVCVLHSEISKGRRSDFIDGIISGRHDIVIGTRYALLAPLKKVSLIMVLNEHSESYKPEEGIRYNFRDAAIMRGFFEKTTVLLTSVTPSVDSYFNALVNKYRLVKPRLSVSRPSIKIVDMRFEKTLKSKLSKTVYEASRKYIGRGGKIMFVINRRGYSSMLLCKECGMIEHCADCKIPLVIYKNENELRCRYCGKVDILPERCGRCGSYDLELPGAGTQGLQEVAEKIFGVEAARFDSDKAKKKSDIEYLMKKIASPSTKIVIGTKMMTGRLIPNKKFSMAAVLNIDTSLNLPDFRATEKAYHEMALISELVEPDGEVIIQTRFPQNPVFKRFRANEYADFVKEEILLRKELNYPPYSKLMNITFDGDDKFADNVIKTIKDQHMDIGILGPTVIRNKKGRNEFSILLMSANRNILNKVARAVLDKSGRGKGPEIRIDVDPL